MKNEKGFTLFELLLSVTLIVLLSLGGSTLYFSLSRYTAQNELLRLFHTLQFARSEAIKSNQRVTVCASSNFEQCDKENRNDWSKGYIILSQDHTLLRIEKSAHSITLKNKNEHPIRFHGDGHCSTPTTLTLVTETENNKHRQIKIALSGRIRTI